MIDNSDFRKYHKIQSIYKRDMDSPKKQFIIGDFSCPEFEYLQNNQWEFTEKVDGTNVRVLWDGEGFRFGGRTDNAQMPVSIIDELHRTFNKYTFAKELEEGTQVMIYGEGYGGNIQKRGPQYSTSIEFVVFDILIGQFWLEPQSVRGMCARLQLNFAPPAFRGSLRYAIDRVKGGIESAWGGFEAEGVVGIPRIGLKARNGKRIITKIKAKDFK